MNFLYYMFMSTHSKNNFRKNVFVQKYMISHFYGFRHRDFYLCVFLFIFCCFFFFFFLVVSFSLCEWLTSYLEKNTNMILMEKHREINTEKNQYYFYQGIYIFSDNILISFFYGYLVATCFGEDPSFFLRECINMDYNV